MDELQCIRIPMDKKASVYTASNEVNSSLIKAAEENQPSVLKALIKAGACVECSEQ